ncbi:MAG: hypothetical protein JXR60_07420 [Bacteroidales bacterium]|nr:hypothetical protein [Bacteroidales bacterium]
MKNNSFEDIFNSISNHQADVSNKIWSNIENNLEETEFNSYFQTEFSNFIQSPSTKSWSAISKALPKQLFWGLSKLQLFAGSSVAVIAIISTIFLVNSNKTKSDTTNLSRYEENNLKVIDFDNQGTNNNNSVYSNSSALINSPNNNSENFSNTFKTQGFPVNPKKKKDKKSGKETGTNSTSGSTISSENSNIIIDEQIAEKKFIIDTITIVDTIKYYDTIPVIAYKTNQSNKKWEIEPYLNIFNNNSTHRGENNINQEWANLYNKANKSSISYSLGLNMFYRIGQFKIGSGLAYTQIEEEFEYETNEIKTNSVNKMSLTQNGYYWKKEETYTYTYIPYCALEFDTISFSYTVNKIEHENYMVIDTTWTYKVDTLVTNKYDTITHVLIDSSRVATYDTNRYSTIDTTYIKTYYNNINKYSYLEIPLNISYGFKLKSFTIRPTAGAILGFMLNAKGTGISFDDRNKVYSLSESELPMMNIQISGQFGVGLEYEFNDAISLSVQPFYRRSLNSVYRSSAPISKHFNGVGVHFGVIYKL